MDTRDLVWAMVAGGLLVLGWLATRAAWRNGVRDGYVNTWLPSVREIVKAENLRQGRRCDRDA